MSAVQLVAPTVALQLAGEGIVIKPFTFGQWPQVVKRLSRVFGTIQAAGSLSLPELIAEGGEDVLELLALAAGKPRAWLDMLSGDEGLQLAAAVIELNKEELTKKTIPALAKLGPVLAAQNLNA